MPAPGDFLDVGEKIKVKQGGKWVSGRVVSERVVTHTAQPLYENGVPVHFVEEVPPDYILRTADGDTPVYAEGFSPGDTRIVHGRSEETIEHVAEVDLDSGERIELRPDDGVEWKQA